MDRAEAHHRIFCDRQKCIARNECRHGVVGYHVCFTCRRSPVRTWMLVLFFVVVCVCGTTWFGCVLCGGSFVLCFVWCCCPCGVVFVFVWSPGSQLLSFHGEHVKSKTVTRCIMCMCMCISRYGTLGIVQARYRALSSSFFLLLFSSLSLSPPLLFSLTLIY